MISSKSVVGIITARGGSKGLPGKNVIDLGGRPMVAWTISAALGSAYIDRLIISTDDEEIADTAKSWNCEVPFIRPDHLAQDDTSSVDVAIHALQTLKETYHYFVLLQPTSPFRTNSDIDNCLELCAQTDAPACVSICGADKSPYWMVSMDQQSHLHHVLEPPTPASRRQELPQVYSLNGAVYVAEVNWFEANETFLTEETRGYVMPRERSLDIDTEYDLSVAKCRLAYR